jgi:hypothetical protein
MYQIKNYIKHLFFLCVLCGNKSVRICVNQTSASSVESCLIAFYQTNPIVENFYVKYLSFISI